MNSKYSFAEGSGVTVEEKGFYINNDKYLDANYYVKKIYNSQKSTLLLLGDSNNNFIENNVYMFGENDYYQCGNSNDTNDINDTQFVQLSIKPKQLFILPSYWLFYVNDNIDTYFLYGAFNLLLAFSKICF